jgi:hypothetical protein
MVGLAGDASAKGAGTCLGPREEAWGRFPFFAFDRGGDGMRKTLILLVVSLLLLWTGCAFAYHRPIAKPCYGDPDEFQTQKYHDEGAGGFQILGCSRDKRPAAAGAYGHENKQTGQKRRYLLINFAGRTFFLEK